MGEATTNLKLLNLPALAQLLWQRLALYIAEHGDGGRIGIAKAEWLWRRVSMTETETYLETLIGTGLLAVDDAGGLLCPLLSTETARVRASRENGRKGGRPRKAAAVTPQNDARQIAQPLPIPGGLAKPSETQRWETPSAGAHTSSSSSSLKSETTQSVAREGFVQLAMDVIAEGKLTSPRLTFAEAKAWLEEGEKNGLDADGVRAIVLGTVRRLMQRKDPATVNGLRFFTGAITRVMEGKEELADPAATPSERTFYGHADIELDIGVQAWAESGYRGPAPRLRRPEQHAA